MVVEATNRLIHEITHGWQHRLQPCSVTSCGAQEHVLPRYVGLLLAHRSSFGRMPFLPPPVTPVYQGESNTALHLIRICQHITFFITYM